MSTNWLTVADAALELKVSERFVLDELRSKKLRGTKLSGRAGWRIDPDDLDTYLAARANIRPVRRAAS